MKKSYVLLHTAILFLGLSAVFGKLISLNEGLLVWYRLFFSALILLVVLRLFKVNHRISLKEKFAIARIGLLITMSWLFFYASIKYSNISIGVVCACLASFFTAVFEPLINKKSFRLSEFLLSALTMTGIGLIFHFDVSYRLGIVLGVISPAFLALYGIYNQRLIKKYDSKLINYYQMMGGAIGLGVLLPFYLYYFPPKSIVPNLKDTFFLILLSLLCTVFVYVSFTHVLKKIPVFTVNLSVNLEPVYSIVLAFLLFNEDREVNASFYAGLCLAIASVILQTVIAVKKVDKVSNKSRPGG